MIAHLHPLHTTLDSPERFTYPFAYEPHPLCLLAAKEVQDYIATHPDIKQDADKGKMFGVLIVSAPESSSYYFLAAYSGLLAGRNDWPYFVPPVFDAQQPDGYFKTKEREISALTAQNSQLPTVNSQLSTPNSQLSPLTSKKLSQDLQLWLFHQYQLLNARGETKDLVDIWQQYYSRPKLQRRYPLPPGGTGDCCAPKLLQYAYQQKLHPLCMAEFWWGATTKTDLRQHLNFYPACRGKCKPILTWMLQGLDVDPDPESLGFPRLELPTVYEDHDIIVVDKPSGLLSVPGRIEQYSVETIMRERYPDSIVGHRLDMGTSGLQIVAKSLEAYHLLQEQFIRHEVEKKYLARLEEGSGAHTAPKGRISLPLRPDPMNRPRQTVDMEHGKQAITDYELLGGDMVALWPRNGRTHQLRIHCAHPDGLGRPIKGDQLYGTKGDRLWLHATELSFRQPITKQDIHLKSPFPEQ